MIEFIIAHFACLGSEMLITDGVIFVCIMHPTMYSFLAVAVSYMILSTDWKGLWEWIGSAIYSIRVLRELKSFKLVNSRSSTL